MRDPRSGENITNVVRSARAHGDRGDERRGLAVRATHARTHHSPSARAPAGIHHRPCVDPRGGAQVLRPRRVARRVPRSCEARVQADGEAAPPGREPGGPARARQVRRDQRGVPRAVRRAR